MSFTVAITVWKREELLPHAVYSVMRQSWKEWEIRVYSDGSSKKARELVAELDDRIPITYEALRRRRRCWGNHLRRRALEQARTPHVCFLGHDSLLLDGYLAAHAANIDGDPDALSVVSIDYWRRHRPDRGLPAHSDMMRLADGEIDLLCVAYPRRLALELDCFGRGMLRRRNADYLSFDRLRQRVPPIHRDGTAAAVHF